MIKKISLLALFLSCYTTLQAQFITTWETATANESITIPTTGVGYNYTVDWGDGTTSTNQTANATHPYTAAGTYTVSITGDFPRIYFNNGGDMLKIKSIEQWGTQVWTSMGSAFHGCANLQGNATDAPNLSMVISMRFMFYDASSFNQAIGSWNVSNVTRMGSMFSGASSFNQDISAWDVSKVITMGYMFTGASNFNQDISAWDVSNVYDMRNIFAGITFFTENYDALLEGWSKLTLKRGVSFHGGSSVYCNAEVARQKLKNDFGWTITDGGKDCSLSTPDVTADKFKVYPTPTSGNIQIDLDAAIQKITIYNLLGVEVMSPKQVNKKRVDLSALSAGTYILKVQTDTGTVVRKVVKK